MCSCALRVSCLTCSRASRLLYPICLVPYLFLCHTCLVPHVFLCLKCCRALHALIPYVSRILHKSKSINNVFMYSGNKNISNIFLIKRYFATYVVSNPNNKREHVIYLLECI